MADPRQRGPLLGACRVALWPPSCLYSAAARLRNVLYDRGLLGARSVELPVISVGNITAGGTGKTPFVAWLARFLKLRRRSPAILSRGYGRDREVGIDDENRMLGSLVPGVPVVVNPDRLEGARVAIEAGQADVLILDDGFQHRRIARDLDVVLLDALMPFGGGRQLPLGYLREPVSGLRRAHLVVLTRTDLVTRDRVEELQRRVSRYVDEENVVCAAHQPSEVVALRPGGGRQQAELGRLSSGRWAAFCGIGNPEAFRQTLLAQGVELAGLHVYPDHHRYRRADLQALMRAAAARGCEGLVTTEKDAAKVERFLGAGAPLPVLVLRVKMAFTRNTRAVARRVVEAVGAGGL